MTTTVDAGVDEAPSSRSAPARQVERIAGLDGLRAVAVLAVVAYHLDVSWMPGGFLGVDLFMVLSGYLITRLLLQECDRSLSVDVRAFWSRRARRLLPAALTLVVIATGLAAWLFRSDQMHSIRRDALASIYYVANWRFIAASQSYFDLFSEASPFRHLWSLAIEEQFYVAWPLLVLAFHRHRRSLMLATGVLTLASAVAMSVLLDVDDPSRAYYGTETRAQTLLVGCLLAMLLHGRRLGRAEDVAAWLIPIGVVAVVTSFVLIDDAATWMYRGGFLAFAGVTAMLIGAVVSAPTARSVRLLEQRWFALLGRGSYSIYLWHWPIIVFVTPERTGWTLSTTIAARLALIAACATTSYTLIESPIRRRAFSGRRMMVGVVTSMALATCFVLVATRGATAPADYFDATGEVTVNNANGETIDDAPAVSSVTPAARGPILVLGDSVAASLSDGLLAAADSRSLSLAMAPVSGCGLLPGRTVGDDGAVYEPSGSCADAVDSSVGAAFESVAPGLVVWISVWDAENREIDGRTYLLDTADGRALLYDLVNARIDDFTTRGANTVLVTKAPTSASSRPGPTASSDARTTAYNDVLRRVADERDDTSLIDLAGHLCPDGSPCLDVDSTGRPYRPTDGIHFEGAPAASLAAWLLDEIVAVR